MIRNIKLFAFAGLDVGEKGPDILKRLNRKGYTLLPLDVSGIGYAGAAGVPFTLIDDWLGTENIPVAFEESVVCSYGWFESAREEFTVNGVCWPEFDQHAMYWFWIAASLAKSLSKAFREKGVQELRYFAGSDLRPGFFYYLSDVHSAFWSKDVADIVKPFGLSLRNHFNRKLSKTLNSVRNAVSDINRKMDTLKTGQVQGAEEKTPGISELDDKIVMVLNSGEVYRFTPIVRELTNSFPAGLSTIILSGDKQLAGEISLKWSMPVYQIPSKLIISSDLQKKFRYAFSKARELSEGRPWAKALKYLPFHFEYYCDYRWPLLAADFNVWSELWKRFRPRAVVISSLEDAESMLPGKAAMRNNILTISIPHGAVQSKTTGFIASDFVLQHFPIQSRLYKNVGIPSERIITCRSGFAENEHAVDIAEIAHKKELWNILCLFNCIGAPGNLPFAGQASQLNALKILDNPPPDIGDKINMFLKTHPSPEFADLELFDAVSENLRRRVIPLNSALSDVIAKVDLVIAVNYSGSALINVLRSGKPLLLFYNNPLIVKHGLNTTGELFFDAGVLVRRSEDLWDAVRKFFTHQVTAEEMRIKAQEFYRKNLDNSHFPLIKEVMENILFEKQALDN